MDSNQHNQSLTIHNSPIEFVVVGSKGKHNGVLIRSENLKTDLIGFAARGRKDKDNYSTLSLLFFNLIPLRRMYVVNSSSSRSIKYEYYLDERESEYRFCWVGESSSSDRESIRDTFNRYIEDLLLGLQEGDYEQVEWNIAPVILRCSEANIRIRKKRLLTIIIVGTYLAIGLATLGLYHRFGHRVVQAISKR